MKIISLTSFFILSLFCSSCSRNGELISYHTFKDHTWSRFNILRFEIPVDSREKNYDVSLFIRHEKTFDFDAVDFNMIMTTPSGEERIREYHMIVRKRDGSFAGKCNNDSCEVTINLKTQLMLTKGMLTLEIENLVPRLEVGGLLGIGVRLRPS